MPSLIDLPTEILLVILQHFYREWSVQLGELTACEDGRFELQADGMPGIAVLQTCRAMYRLCQRVEEQTFTGRLWAFEKIATLGLLPQNFVEGLVDTPRHQWIQRNVKVIRFHNGEINPAVWKVYLRWDDFPHLRRVELDCRYTTHFAIHNVSSFHDFIGNENGELEKCMDFRRSFFLSCEKFFVHATKRGVKVTVIRAMGVREGRQYCQAVVVAVDYMQDDQGRLVLDMDHVRTQARPIFKWPQGIKPALAALSII